MTHRIVTSSASEKEWITEQLMKFNSSHIGISIEEYIVPLNFHLRNQEDAIVAGVNATMFGKSTVYVDILWVDTASRGKDYGSLLLSHVETEARKAGAVMIHLDTFDFQAQGFYLKQGYELYAELENSPMAGRTRFYLRKLLR